MTVTEAHSNRASTDGYRLAPPARRLGPQLVLLGLLIAAVSGAATAQSLDCYDRTLILPQSVTQQDADFCHGRISEENTTNDLHAISLYNAARMYNALADGAIDPKRRSDYFDRAVTDIQKSRDRASDQNPAFNAPWRNGNRKQKEAQLAANRFFLADRSYQLGRAYVGLASVGGAPACPDAPTCLDLGLNELEHDEIARVAGALHEDYIYLRAVAFQRRGDIEAARRDFEALRNSARFQALAGKALGEIYLAAAARDLEPPLTLAGVTAARSSFSAAQKIAFSEVEGQLGLARTFLLEAKLTPIAANALQAYRQAHDAFDVIVASGGDADATQLARAYAGRGEATLEAALLQPGGPDLASAISDLKHASDADHTLSGAEAQLNLALALAAAGHEAEANAAFADAEMRFGLDPRAGAVRAERDYFNGRLAFGRNQYSAASDAFARVSKEALDSSRRADAHFYLSAIDLRLSRSGVANADAASSAAGGGSPYAEQACLTRIAAGGEPVSRKTALAACSGNDMLQGLFYLRNAQLVSAVSEKNQARRLAQDAFARARRSTSVIVTAPGATSYAVAELAAFGDAVAIGCSSAAGLTVSADLDPARLDTVRRFFMLHSVFDCVAPR